MTAPGGASSRSVRIVISADVASAIRAFNTLNTGLGGVGRQAEQAQRQTSRMGDVMKGALGAAGITAGLTGIVGGLKSVVSGGLDYERSVNTFQAVTQASADEMSKMAETAKALGSDIKIPGASAQTAAAAMTELAKGGLTAQEAMEASRGTMILAAAAQIDGANAAEIQANALQTFGLKADQAGRVANVLANVANKSSGEITDFSQALSQSGAVANLMGLSIEDTATALGLFANAGLKGSDAGTSLKTSLTALLNPSEQSQKAIDALGLTVKDSSGNFVGYRSLVEQLTAAKGRMSQMDFNAAAAQVLGTDAVRAGAIVAAGGTAAWDEMASALGNVNGAQDVAAANSKGLTGVIDALKNTVDTASLTLFESLQPSIMKVAEAATGLITPLAEGLSPALSSVADLATGTLAPAIGGLTGVITAVAGPISSLVGWVNELPGPVGAGVLALAGVIALRGPLTATFAGWTGSAGTLIATLRGTAGAAAAGSAGLAGYIASIRVASGAAATFGVVAKGALAVLGGPIGLAIIGVATALTFFSSSTDEAAASQTDFAGAIDQTTGKLNDQAGATISAKVASSGLGEQYKAMGGDVADLVDAIGGIPGKQELVNKVIADAQTAAAGTSAAYTDMGAAATGTSGALDTTALSFNNTTVVAGKQTTAYKDATAAGKTFNELLGSFAGAQDTAKVSAEGLHGELGKVGSETDKTKDAFAAATEKTTPFGDALKEVKSATSEADAAAQFLTITLLEMGGGTVTAEQRTRANAAAMREAAGSYRDLAEANQRVTEKQAVFDNIAAHLGATLDGQEVSSSNLAVTQADVDRASWELADAQDAVKAAGDRQADSLDKAAESARKMTSDAYSNAVAQGGMKAGIDAAVETMKVQREQFILSAIDADTDRAAAEKLADAQGLIPAYVATTYQTVGAEDAKQRADELNAALDKINDRTVHYSIVGGEVTTVGTMRATLGERAVFATGGVIPGPVSARDNTIIAARTGEGVVVPEFVSAVGGEPGINRLNRLAESGNFPGFAKGGVVNASVAGDYQAGGYLDSLQKSLESYNQKVKESGGGVRSSFINAALSKQGTQYVWGAAGPDVFDCSGLVSWALEQAGIGKGRLTAQGFNAGFPHVGSPGKPGDLATFDTGRLPGQAGHIGIITDPARGLMMHTDGAGPARVSDYLARDGGPLSIVDVVGNAIGSGISGAFGFGPNGAVGDLPSSAGGDGVERWRGLGLDVLSKVGAYKGMSLTQYIGQMMNQIRTESSGDPNAINNYDRNAQRGDPSIGLLQVIGETFRRALSGTPFEYLISRGQRDPEASLTASTLYSLNQYGSLPAAWRGVAYDQGGVVPPGWNSIYNGLGEPEHMLTGPQWSTAQNAINHVVNNSYTPSAAAAPVDVQITLRGGDQVAEMFAQVAEVRVNGKMAGLTSVIRTESAVRR